MKLRSGVRMPGAAMKCLACGAEMRLINVRSEATTPFAIERSIFQCSSCRQSAQRLRFDRTRMPFSTSPAITPSSAPTVKLQRERDTVTSTSANAVETQSSRALVSLEPRRPVDWCSVVGKVSIALKEKASEARAAAWARTMEKLRSRQMALKERAAPFRSTFSRRNHNIFSVTHRRTCEELRWFGYP
jgi:predicted RNA-binding Zn-ribbon protein involved in translation (DUF1610 family)